MPANRWTHGSTHSPRPVAAADDDDIPHRRVDRLTGVESAAGQVPLPVGLRVRRVRRPPQRLRSYLEDAVTGYGYRPGRALGWLAALTIATASGFTGIHHDPSNRTVHRSNPSPSPDRAAGSG